MALALYKRSRFSRVYREGNQGFMKATISPMHYESVYGSGDYDTAIDLTMPAVVTDTLDGLSCETAGHHLGVQVVDPAVSATQPNTQDSEGTISFGGRNGANTLKFKGLQAGYLHDPTVAFTALGDVLDYTAQAPTFTTYTRNLGDHANTTDEVVVSNNSLQWENTASVGTDDIYVDISVRPEMVRAQYAIYTTDWLRANQPPVTTPSETKIGFLLEMDWSDIPHVYLATGAEVDPSTDDFNNDDGDIAMRDESGNLIGYVEVSSYGRVGFGENYSGPVSSYRFYEDSGTTYCFIGIEYDVFLLSNPTYNMSWRMTVREKDAPQLSNTVTDFGGFPTYGPQNVQYYDFVAGIYGYDGALGARFYVDVPNGALTSNAGDGEYAAMVMYHQTNRFPGRQFLPGDLYMPHIQDSFVDISGSQGQWTTYQNPRVDPITDSPWSYRGVPNTFEHSYYFGTTTTTDAPAQGAAFENPFDLSYPVEEALAVTGWREGDVMRVSLEQNASNGYGKYNVVQTYRAPDSNSSVLNIAFTAPADWGFGTFNETIDAQLDGAIVIRTA